MRPVRARLKGELRSRWRAWAAIAMLIGVAGGVVLTTAAGARRTDTAYARYLRYARGADVIVSPQDRGVPDYYPALARLPDVADIGVIVGLQGFTPDLHGASFLLHVAADTHLGATVERPKLTEGRMIRPDRADETVAGRTLATALHLHVGSTVHLVVAPTNASGADASKARPLTLKVVGIGVARDDVVSVNALATAPSMLVTPALLRQFESDYESYSSFDGAYVRLRPGASRTAFTRRADELATHFPETGNQIFVADEHVQAAAVEHAIRPQATALALFALRLPSAACSSSARSSRASCCWPPLRTRRCGRSAWAPGSSSPLGSRRRASWPPPVQHSRPRSPSSRRRSRRSGPRASPSPTLGSA